MIINQMKHKKIRNGLYSVTDKRGRVNIYTSSEYRDYMDQVEKNSSITKYLIFGIIIITLIIIK